MQTKPCYSTVCDLSKGNDKWADFFEGMGNIAFSWDGGYGNGGGEINMAQQAMRNKNIMRNYGWS